MDKKLSNYFYIIASVVYVVSMVCYIWGFMVSQDLLSVSTLPVSIWLTENAYSANFFGSIALIVGGLLLLVGSICKSQEKKLNN